MGAGPNRPHWRNAGLRAAGNGSCRAGWRVAQPRKTENSLDRCSSSAGWTGFRRSSEATNVSRRLSDWRASSRQAMATAGAKGSDRCCYGLPPDVWDVQAMIWRVLTRFRAVSALRPEVVRCGFCSHSPCLKHGALWRARWPRGLPRLKRSETVSCRGRQRLGADWP